MTDATPVPVLTSREKVAATLKRRYRAELRFRAYGLSAVLIGIMCVVFLFWTIIQKGYTAFEQTYIQLDVAYSAEDLDPAGRRAPDDLQAANYQLPVRAALRAAFPDVQGRSELKKLYGLVSGAAEQTLRDRVLANPRLIGQRDSVWVLADDRVDMLAKGKIDRSLPESDRAIDDMELRLFDALKAGRHVEVRFNSPFFTSGDSREPEQAGVLGALVGTLLTLLVTLVISFPIGVAAAVYLEEFARRNRLTDLIEVNINNLAAVPSIVFGLLGLAMFIQFFGLPRSAPLVGGLVLSLMTLPTIIIASRSALKAVPPSIREAAFGMGASKVQTVMHHVLPLAMPGMLTGAIIGMARALGESAPLLMIGMVAFIVDVPKGLTDPATVLPVQIFLWATSPERAFVERTSGAIMVLLAFLLLMNAVAVFLRSRFERRW
ncbi:MAG: phosphate ABC transporter permease PstA [Proteobacteria bacterium]|nr:phosphate ABC transporter permease PstA [Pseudomonadota bacterium]